MAGGYPCTGCLDDPCVYAASDGSEYADTFGGALDSDWTSNNGTWSITDGKVHRDPGTTATSFLYRTIVLDCDLDEFIVEVDIYDALNSTDSLDRGIGIATSDSPFIEVFTFQVDSIGGNVYTYEGPATRSNVIGPVAVDGDKLSIKINRVSDGQYTFCFYHNETLLAEDSGAWTSPAKLFPAIRVNTGFDGTDEAGDFDNYTSELHLLPCIAQDVPPAFQSVAGTVFISGTVVQTETPAIQLAAGVLGPTPCSNCTTTPATVYLVVEVFSDGNVALCDNINGTWTLNQDGADPCKWKTSTAFQDNEFHFEVVIGATTITSKIRALNKCNDEDGYEYTWVHTRGGADCNALCAVLTFDNQANGPDWSDCDVTHVDKACNVSTDTLTLDSTGTFCGGITGTATQTETSATQALAGTVTGSISGTVVQTETPAIQVAAGAVLIAGSIAQTAPSATQVLIGISTVSGTITQTETPATQSASGAVLVNGTMSQTAPSATQSLNGISTITGTITQTETVAIQSAAGAVLVAGTAVQVETVATQLAAGGVLVAGTIIQTCPAGTQTAAGAVTISGSIAQTSPTSTQAAMGTVSAGTITGTAAQTAPASTQTLTGFVTISGTASQTAVVAVQSLIGGVQISGSITQTETPATQTASGGVEVAGTIAQTCPVETQTASGKVAIDGNIAQTCPPEEQSLTGATCSNFGCVYQCQAGGGAWTVITDDCFATSCTCGPGPPDGECLEGVNELEERSVDCVPL